MDVAENAFEGFGGQIFTDAFAALLPGGYIRVGKKIGRQARQVLSRSSYSRNIL